ncbi:MAG: phage late control family protein [Paenibacillaceae bacterium]|jgi:phage protein D|nr:phage late control family protein [Paenibacillaceae bacterium]
MADVTLPTGSYDYSTLETKYQAFMAPTGKVKFNGNDAGAMAIASIRIQMSAANDADTATILITDAFDLVERQFKWIDSSIKIGSTVEIEMGYVDKLTALFYGHITSIQYQFTSEGTPSLVVTAMDISFKMMRGQKSRLWNNKKISDVVTEIAQEYGISSSTVDATTEQHAVLAKGRESDYRFIQNLALGLNYEFFFVGKKMYFRKKMSDKSPTVTLSYMKNLTQLQLEHNLAEQVSEVEVRGWNVKEQKEITGKSGTIHKSGSGQKTGKDLLQAMGGVYTEVIYANPPSVAEANKIAEAILNERALKLVSGEGECVGLPEIRAGRFIKFDGLSKELNLAYYVTRAVHMLDSNGYRTLFQIQGNVV